MQRELQALWRGLRRHDDVRCIVLTGAGEKAFCTGIDRMEQMGGDTDDTTDDSVVGSGSTPFMFNDPGDNIGPKSCDLWKPVIAAVNGMACGGAFYMLGEVEFIIAADARDVLRPARHLRHDRGLRADAHGRDHAVRRDHAADAARQPRAPVGRPGPRDRPRVRGRAGRGTPGTRRVGRPGDRRPPCPRGARGRSARSGRLASSGNARRCASATRSWPWARARNPSPRARGSSNQGNASTGGSAR